MNSNKSSIRLSSLLILSVLLVAIFAGNVFAHNWNSNFVTPSSWTGFYNSSVDAEETSEMITQSSGWENILDAGFSSGGAISVMATADSVSTVEFTFSGLGVDWYSKMGPDQGIAKIYIDGVLVESKDMYAASDTYGVAFSAEFQALNYHSILIEAAPNSDTNYSNDNIVVDKFQYLKSNDRPVAVDRKMVTTSDSVGTYDVFTGHHLKKPRIENGRVVYEYHTGATHSQTDGCSDIGKFKVEIRTTEIVESNNVGLDISDFITPVSSQNGIHVPNLMPSVYGDLVVWQSGISDFNNDCNTDLYYTNLTTGSNRLIETAAAPQINTVINANKVAYQSKMKRGNSQKAQSDWDIYYINLNNSSGRTPISLTSSNLIFDQIQPTIDGDLIAYSDNRSGVYNIYVYTISTKKEKQVSSSPCDQIEPSLSGGILVWQEFTCSDTDPNWDIMGTKVVAGKMKKVNVTNNQADQFHPRTDGNTVVWEDWRNDDDGVWSNGLEAGFHKSKDNPDIYMLSISSVNPADLGNVSNLVSQVTSDLTPEINPDISSNLVVFEKVDTAGVDYSADPPSIIDCRFYPIGSGDIDPSQANYSRNCLYPNAIYMKDIATFITARNS